MFNFYNIIDLPIHEMIFLNPDFLKIIQLLLKDIYVKKKSLKFRTFNFLFCLFSLLVLRFATSIHLFDRTIQVK